MGVGGQRADETDAVLDDRDGDGDGDNVQDEKVGAGENKNKSDGDVLYKIDGVRVDDLELPRGWRDLKRHYTYDPSMPSE